MRIVLDLQAAQSLSRYRGIGRYTLSLAKAFAGGASQHELYLALNGHDPDVVAGLIREFDGLVPRDRVRICELPGNIRACDLSNAWRRKLATAVYETFISSFEADFVWHGSLFEGWGDDTVTGLGSGYQDRRHMATLYDLIPMQYAEETFGNAWHRSWYYQRLALVKRCRMLFAISDHARREAMEALRIPGERIVAISGAAHETFVKTGMDAGEWAAWEEGIGLGRDFLLYAGGYDAHKNVGGLVSAYAMLPGSLRRMYPLVLAGHCRASAQRDLERHGRLQGLAGSELLFTGSVTDRQLAQLYSQCSGFVAPSLHEGLGLPVLEAMACGAPVVGSGTTGLAEVIGLPDAMFDPRSVSSMADKLLRLLTDSGFSETLREYARVQNKRFTWGKSASRALAAIEEAGKADRSSAASGVPRPRLYVVSPVPPIQSGIADYAARLLRELGAMYRVVLILDQHENTDPWVQANFPVRSWTWLRDQPRMDARILYHFGNSEFHTHMFELLRRHPGVVMLHDSLLGGVRNWMAEQGGEERQFLQALYESHGYRAILDDARDGRAATIDRYPMSADVLRLAQGVLVHSQHAVELCRRFFGRGAADRLVRIPFPVPARDTDRRAARTILRFQPDDLLVCSFGMLAPTKLNHRLVAAWAHSSLASRPDCHLVFVGERHRGAYGEQLHRDIEALPHSERVHVTDFVSARKYSDYLDAADFVVQLRSTSRGETSAALFDALSRGKATIVNAHGSAAELPDGKVLKLDDEFSDEELMEALEMLAESREMRDRLGGEAQTWVRQAHNPADVAARYRDVIEECACGPWRGEARRQLDDLHRAKDLEAPETESLAPDWKQAGEMLLVNEPRLGCPRVFLDVTSAATGDFGSAQGQAVQNLVSALLRIEQTKYRIEPVRLFHGRYLHATHFGFSAIGRGEVRIPETPVRPEYGDLFLGLDSSAGLACENGALLQRWHVLGMRMVFLVGERFAGQEGVNQSVNPPLQQTRWLEFVAQYADSLVCPSRDQVGDLQEWLCRYAPDGRTPPVVGYLHSGSVCSTIQAGDVPSVPGGDRDLAESWRKASEILWEMLLDAGHSHWFASPEGSSGTVTS